MKLKSVKLGLLIALFLLLTACSSSDASGSEANLSFSHFWPSHHIVQTDVIEKLQTTLDEESDGNMKLEIYPTGQLGAPDEQYNLAVDGTADISLSVHGYTPGIYPLTSVSDLPFISTSSEDGSKIMQTLYDEFPEIQAEHDDVHPLWLFTGEPNQILSASKPVKSLKDLKGLKVRSPSTQMNAALEALGAVPVSMPVNDIYESLNKGVIDAAMAGVSTINDMKLYEVVDYITITNISSSSMFTVMNKDSYASLSDDNKEILNKFATTGAVETGKALDVGGQAGLDKAKEEGIEIIELSDDEIARWTDVVNPVIKSWIKEMEDKGLPGQAIYDRAKELGSN